MRCGIFSSLMTACAVFLVPFVCSSYNVPRATNMVESTARA
jgi:hypothetical protein